MSKVDHWQYTKDQLKMWGCKFHDLITGHRDGPFCLPTKPHFDLLIDDKSKRIEEL